MLQPFDDRAGVTELLQGALDCQAPQGILWTRSLCAGVLRRAKIIAERRQRKHKLPDRTRSTLSDWGARLLQSGSRIDRP